MSFWKTGGYLKTQVSSEIIKIIIKISKFVYFHTNGFTMKRFAGSSFNNCTIKKCLKAQPGEGDGFFLRHQMSSPAPFTKAQNPH